MIKELIDVFVKQLKLSEDEAIVAALAAATGFAVDFHFFPLGMPPGTVTALSGGGALLFTKWFKNRPWYQDWALRRIDALVEKGHLPKQDGDEMKAKLIKAWYSKLHESSDDKKPPSKEA